MEKLDRTQELENFRSFSSNSSRKYKTYLDLSVHRKTFRIKQINFSKIKRKKKEERKEKKK